jgi:hypothetical protein
MPLQHVTELLDIVLFAARLGRWRVVLALVVPREDGVELAIGDVICLTSLAVTCNRVCSFEGRARPIA